MTELTNERKAAEHEYSVSAFDYAAQPIGSREWCLYWDGWQAARRATPSSECALPPLPAGSVYCALDMKGQPLFDKGWMFAPIPQLQAQAPLYTAEQVEQIRREAVEADRRGRANSPEFEGIKTHLASAAQGVKTLPEDLLDELNDAVIEALNQAFAMKDWGARDHWRDVLTRFEDWRAAPPLSSEPQADA